MKSAYIQAPAKITRKLIQTCVILSEARRLGDMGQSLAISLPG
jgi:hypothetical protein